MNTRSTPPPVAAAAGTLTLDGDLVVSRMGFGAMRLTGKKIWGEPPSRADAHRVLRRAVALGVDLIDTADAYGPEVDEELIAEALHPYPAGLVIATKGGVVRPAPEQWKPNGRPEHLRRACEGSLRRLRLERIDLYQLHTPDPDVPLEDSVGALVDLQAEGKVCHIGLSNVDPEQLERARAIARVVSVQNRYNLSERESDEVMEVCERDGLAFLPWRPLAAGRLLENGEILKRIARNHGATPAQVALAWLLARSPVMLPIPGTSRLEHLEENLGAAELRLSEHEIGNLNAASG